MKFCCTMTPRYKDIDRMGYLHNSMYQVYFEEGRIEMTRETGYSYGNLENDGVLLPISEAKYNYKVPVLYDDVVKVYTWFEYIKSFSAKCCFKITKDDDKTLVATGYSIHACIDAKTKEFCEMPDGPRDLWSKYKDEEKVN